MDGSTGRRLGGQAPLTPPRKEGAMGEPGFPQFKEYPYKMLSTVEVEKLGLPWFMRNNIPDKDLPQRSYVYNLDSEGNQGTHFTCFCLKKPVIYYVDPFGTELNGYPPEELREWGREHGYTQIVANEDDFQHIQSWLCGWYACYFALKMKKHFGTLTQQSFDKIIHQGLTKYPSQQNISIITDWGKKRHIM